MKSITLLATLIFSLNAFSFTTITLVKEVELKQERGMLRANVSDYSGMSGSDYCTVDFSSVQNADSLKIAAGTTFEVISVDQNKCGSDWGRVCRLDLMASNVKADVNLYLTCKDKGALASELTPKKVSKTLKKFLTVK